MKKFVFLTLVSLTLLSVSYAAENNSPYVIDDQQVEQLFTNSVDVSMSGLTGVDNSTNSPLAAMMSPNMQKDKNAAYFASGDKSFVAAILLNFFLGGLGIHRLYLGTKTFTWVGYILTCGGIFGIVPLVDFIVLIIHNDDISPYVDNPRFFMWSGQ